MEALDPQLYRDLVRRALEEDLRDGDVTTESTISATQQAHGIFVAKSDCVLAGLDVAFETFKQLETSTQKPQNTQSQAFSASSAPAKPKLASASEGWSSAFNVGHCTFTVRKHDGERCRAGDEIADVIAPARTLLAGERTALNFLQRLSGIATRARQFVDASGGRITILDTRKTTPTLRALEKYAVRAGGASNHRAGLFDAVLIKDNHIRLAGGVRNAIDRVRAHRPEMPIEIEAETLEQVDEALAASVTTILLDNMSTGDIRAAVERVHGRAKIEISGGLTLDRLPELAATGADFVSVGALTHSAPAADISFEIEPL